MYQAGMEVEAAVAVEILSLATVDHVVGKDVAAIPPVAVLEMSDKSKADDQEVAIRTFLNTKTC